MSARFREFTRDELDPAQREAYDGIAAGRRAGVPSIFHLYLHSPELCGRVQRLGAFCRYETGLPPLLSELAILVVAKHWEAAYEWSVHEHEARAAGVAEATIQAIKAGRAPALDDPDERLVYDFASTLFATRDVPDALYQAAIARFGTRTVVELSAVLGYYSMLAIALRIFRVPPQT